MKTNKLVKKLLALILVTVFIASLTPANVFAAPPQTGVQSATKAVVPKKLKLNYASMTVQVKKKFPLSVTYTPIHSAFGVKWSSSDKTVATVSAKGVVTAKKVGTTNITVAAKYGTAKATCKVTVQKGAVAVGSVTAKAMTLSAGTTKTLQFAVTPITADAKSTFKSADAKIATVDAKGVVTGVSAGSTNITVTAGKKKATVKVSVLAAPGADAPVYRALLIGNYNYVAPLTKLTGPKYDLNHMKELLGATLNGPNKNIPMRVTAKANLGRPEIFSAINSAFAGAKENAVSYLYYSGHGAGPPYFGESYICGIRGGTDGFISAHELEAALSQIPGKVVVLMDSCNSGGFINRSAIIRNADGSSDADAFNNSMIDAFKPKMASRAYLSDDTTEKYYVLTACSKAQTSLEYYYIPFGYSAGLFTSFLYFGAYDYTPQSYTSIYSDFPAKFKADTDKNKIITLKEQYNYCDKSAKYMTKISPWDFYDLDSTSNSVQVYPKNSDFALFSFR